MNIMITDILNNKYHLKDVTVQYPVDNIATGKIFIKDNKNITIACFVRNIISILVEGES